MDANGNKVTNTYDVLDRLTKTTDSLNKNTLYGYDDSGNLIAVTDANTKITRYAYDLSGQLMAVTDALNSITQYGYDIQGNVTAITDAENRTTTNTYDVFNRLTKIADPMNRETDYAYDANDNLTSKTDENRKVIGYDYDIKDQLTKVSYTSGKIVNFSYDPAGNLTRSNDGSTTATYMYDKLNRVTSVSTNFGTFSKSILYTYDAFGNVKTMVDAEGKITNYKYDVFNRLDTITFPGNKILNYDYDPAGRLTKKTLPNGVFTDYTYDSANRLLTLINKKSDASVLSNFVYTHDNAGNRTSMNTAQGLHNFTYDNIYRLSTADHPAGTDETYTYDKVGNRKTSNVASDWTVNPNNELTNYDGVGFEYDRNGNTTKKTDDRGQITGYRYDGENRLISVNANIAYQYDPFGKRISKTVSGVKTNYLYANEDVLEEFDTAGTNTKKYWHGQGIDEPVAVLNGAGVVQGYYLTDGLGSVVQIVDESQNVIKSYQYDAFGNIINETGSLTQPYTYTSREYDPETGLYYYRARYYDPNTGRFLTEDPIGWFGGPNFYAFIGNNVLNFVDPFGLEAIFVHGTYSGPGIFEESFVSAVMQSTGDNTYMTFQWSGGNTDNARQSAALELAWTIKKYNKEHPNEKINVIAHSHGGNVAMLSTQWVQIDNLILLGTPIREYAPDLKNTPNIVNVCSKDDEVQTRGGGGWRIGNHQAGSAYSSLPNGANIQNISVSGFGHSELYSTKLWNSIESTVIIK